jgi:hypothetical protein
VLSLARGQSLKERGVVLVGQLRQSWDQPPSRGRQGQRLAPGPSVARLPADQPLVEKTISELGDRAFCHGHALREQRRRDPVMIVKHAQNDPFRDRNACASTFRAKLFDTAFDTILSQ